WLALPPDASARNVARQLADPRSILNFYRALVRLRRGSDALGAGSFRAVDSHRDVFAFARQSATETMMVVLNMAGDQRDGRIDCQDPSAARAWRVALGSHRAAGEAIQLDRLRLDAYEAVILAESP